jgi:hypothetical protein
VKAAGESGVDQVSPHSLRIPIAYRRLYLLPHLLHLRVIALAKASGWRNYFYFPSGMDIRTSRGMVIHTCQENHHKGQRIQQLNLHHQPGPSGGCEQCILRQSDMQIEWDADGAASGDDTHCGCAVVSAAPANVPKKIPADRIRQRNRTESFNLRFMMNSSFTIFSRSGLLNSGDE